MAKNGTEFSKYAQAFREVIDGNKTDIDILTKELLKMGLTVNDKNYINEEYPEYIDDNGERHIAGNKGDTLRKYFGGTNDLSRLIPKLETEFDSDFNERYCDELQDYDESRIMAFARVLNIDVNEDAIDIVSEAIANYYSSIVIGSATKKKITTKTSKVIPKTKGNNITLSYTFTEAEKQVINNICTAIKADLRQLESQVKYISTQQYELGKLTDSEPDKRLKPHIEGFIESNTNQFAETYSNLVSLCSDLNTILSPKKRMNKSFAELISITSFFSRDENKEMSIDRFAGVHVQVKVDNLRKYIKYSLREIAMQ
ncbi:MAG: hypothetical protein IKG98_03075 [Ruminococcus sp.]|nr:hypothetical protein [Ruminococcus sp.]